MDNLKPCPYCESFAGRTYDDRVYCHNARFKGECHNSATLSIEDWNTRPLEDALLEALEIAEGYLTGEWEHWKRDELGRHNWDTKPEQLSGNPIAIVLISARAAIAKAKGVSVE